jgi:hypothetical protein
MQRVGWRLGAFALMALLVRAVVPAGYMLAEADTGAGRYLTLELCDAHDGQPMLVDLDTGKIIKAPAKTGNHDKSGQPQPPCLLCANLSAVAAPQPAIGLVQHARAVDIDYSIVRDLQPGRGIAAPPPPSTGPPSTI